MYYIYIYIHTGDLQLHRRLAAPDAQPEHVLAHEGLSQGRSATRKGGTMRLETLVELELINCELFELILLLKLDKPSSPLSSNSSRHYLNRQYPLPPSYVCCVPQPTGLEVI